MQEELIQQFQDGNKRAGDDFYNANIGIIYLALKKSKIVSIDHEETLAIINHAFAKAMKNFKPINGSFANYFMYLAKFYMLRYCRDMANMIRPSRKDFAQNKLTIYCDSFNQVVCTSESVNICIRDKTGMADDLTALEVNEVVDKINKKDRQAFKLYYQGNYSQQEIAEKLKLSQSSVCRSIKNAKKTLSVLLKEVS